ncbi:MAG: hypothetical protein ACP5DZ_10070 [Bacteroidales bacterium]
MDKQSSNKNIRYLWWCASVLFILTWILFVASPVNILQAQTYIITACYNNPTVTTTSASSITTNSAKSGGNVSDAGGGGCTVTVRGVCWNTSGSPSISDDKTIDGPGTGSFTSSITGLSANTTYYVRAYAINENGTAYGTEKSFTTSALPIQLLDFNASCEEYTIGHL